MPEYICPTCKGTGTVVQEHGIYREPVASIVSPATSALPTGVWVADRMRK